MKNRIILVFYIVVAFVILNVVFSCNQLASDGFLEVGFPFVFYREFNGKCFDCEFEQGFLIWKFLMNLLLLIVVVFTAEFFLKKRVEN